MRELKEIEKFFLLTFLRISIAGIALILITDLIYSPADVVSLTIDTAILSACILSYLIRHRNFNLSVLLITCITLVAMVYQCMAVPMNTTTSFSIILIIGFITSILLQKQLLWIMHVLTFTAIIVIFVFQTLDPALRFSPKVSDVITIAITYLVLYIIISYCTALLKRKYDQIHDSLRSANFELYEKANEIEAQNEELLQVQDNLGELNKDLERIVDERTAKIKIQNEVLIKYSYTNAHHLRGPVARLLGLVSIYRLDSKADSNDFFNKIEDQAKEIDDVVRRINSELHIDDPDDRNS